MQTAEVPTTRSLQPRRIGRVNWIGVWTLYLKEVRRFFKIFTQTVAAPVVVTLLFLAIFSLAFGRSVDIGIDISYGGFLAPGLIVMTIMQNSFANTSSSIVIGKVQGNIVDILMPPIGPGELLSAYIAAGLTRGVVVGISSGIALSFFVGFNPAHFAVSIAFAIASSTALAMIGVLAGLWAEKFDHLSAVTNFIITPLAFLSGTFYSVERLPGIWNDLAHLNPFFYMIDGFRYGMIGWSDTSPLVGAVVIASLNILLFGLCYHLLKIGYKLKS